MSAAKTKDSQRRSIYRMYLQPRDEIDRLWMDGCERSVSQSFSQSSIDPNKKVRIIRTEDATIPTAPTYEILRSLGNSSRLLLFKKVGTFVSIRLARKRIRIGKKEKTKNTKVRDNSLVVNRRKIHHDFGFLRKLTGVLNAQRLMGRKKTDVPSFSFILQSHSINLVQIAPFLTLQQPSQSHFPFPKIRNTEE